MFGLLNLVSTILAGLSQSVFVNAAPTQSRMSFSILIFLHRLSLTIHFHVELSALDPYPTKPRVTFNKDGTFKITVFSDLHFGENPWDDWGPQQDVNSTQLMRTVLADERPDYV